jgi:uncharacterized protein (DUF433 family)
VKRLSSRSERSYKVNHPFITINPAIAGGKPIIKGTRITVEMLAEEHVAGRTIEQLQYSYPHLSVEEIKDALAYAAEMKLTNMYAD